nr:hypothetical protein [Candidatus Woesearchaeota archaeon]
MKGWVDLLKSLKWYEKLVYFLGLLLVILLTQYFISGYIHSSVNYEDFDISATWENKIDDTFYFDYSEGVFHSWFELKVTSLRDDLYYRVYDKSINIELTEYGGVRNLARLNQGAVYVDIFNADAKLKTIDQLKEIEVCVSSKQDFTKSTEGIVCKSTFLQPRNINIEVNSDPLTFISSKSSFEQQYKWLTVKNIGDTTINVCVFLPSYASYANEKLDYPRYKPQYGTRWGFGPEGEGTQNCEILEPSESSKYEVAVFVGNVGEFDTPLGTHTSQGIVGAVFGEYLGLGYAHYKKSFTLETTVIQ